MASLFTRKGVELAKALRTAGYRLVEVKGHTRDGDLTILYVEIARRLAQKLVRDATAVDESCFCIVNDVRVASLMAAEPVSVRPSLPKASPQRGM